jgi:hypothetical protein
MDRNNNIYNGNLFTGSFTHLQIVEQLSLLSEQELHEILIRVSSVMEDKFGCREPVDSGIGK